MGVFRVKHKLVSVSAKTMSWGELATYALVDTLDSKLQVTLDVLSATVHNLVLIKMAPSVIQ